METRRWTNPSLPQTLQIAVFLLYIEAVFGLLFPAQLEHSTPSSRPRACCASAWPRRWPAGPIDRQRPQVGLPAGPGCGAGAAGRPADARAGHQLRDQDVPATCPLEYNPIGLLFEIALVALLLHPQSREHEPIWFK